MLIPNQLKVINKHSFGENRKRNRKRQSHGSLAIPHSILAVLITSWKRKRNT